MGKTKPADIVSILRIILTAVLFYVAAKEMIGLFIVLYIVTGLSDALDGYIARRLKQTSKRGAQLDSIADHIFNISSIFWLIWLVPEILQEIITLAVIAIAAATYIIVKVGMTRKLQFIHLWPSKVATASLFIIVLYFLVLGFNRYVLYIWTGILLVALVYELRLLRRRR